jgi:hypothetical protein
MRKEVPDDNDETYDSEVARRSRRRKKVVAGVTGITVLGVGAILWASAESYPSGTQATGDTFSSSPALSPSASVSSPLPTAKAGPSVSPAAPEASKVVTATALEQRVTALRSLAKNKTSDVQRPLPPAVGGYKVAADEIDMKQTGSLQKDREMMKVYSARADLTGQQELAWITDAGEAQGTTRCTQKIRVSADSPAKERPTLLICWRTSAKKSVYTVAVKVSGRPSKAKSVAAVNRAWAALG